MKDDFELSSWELEQLKRRTPFHQQFAKRYPVAISNVIDRLDSPPLPEGYEPKWIDFYYFDGADKPHISFVKGELKYIDLPESIAESRLIHVQIDGSKQLGNFRAEGDRGWESPQHKFNSSPAATPSAAERLVKRKPTESQAKSGITEDESARVLGLLNSSRLDFNNGKRIQHAYGKRERIMR